MSTLSIIICTYNRAELLRKAIQSICDQDTPVDDIEVLIVDNNSNDHTSQVAFEFNEKLNIRYVIERHQGLSHARNRGYQEADADYVGYIDDDATIPPHWLRLAKSVIAVQAPAILGGPIREYFESPRPKWFLDSYLGDNRIRFEAPGRLKPDQWLFGGNLLLRRDILAFIGGFPTSQGMSGNKIAYGEETYVVDKVRSNFPDEVIYAHPDLYIHHLIRPEKTRLLWLFKSSFARGRSQARHERLLNPNTQSQLTLISSTTQIGFHLLLLVIKLSLSPILGRRTGVQRYPNLQSYVIALISGYMVRFGAMSEGMTTSVSSKKQGKL